MENKWLQITLDTPKKKKKTKTNFEFPVCSSFSSLTTLDYVTNKLEIFSLSRKTENLNELQNSIRFKKVL